MEAEAAASQAEADGSSHVSLGGDETISVTMDDLEADIELDVHIGHEAGGYRLCWPPLFSKLGIHNAM